MVQEMNGPSWWGKNPLLDTACNFARRLVLQTLDPTYEGWRERFQESNLRSRSRRSSGTSCWLVDDLYDGGFSEASLLSHADKVNEAQLGGEKYGIII